MSLENYIKVYQAIPDAKIISNFIQYLNKTFKEQKFKEGSLHTSEGNETNKGVRDVDILELSNMSESLSNVHWANFLRYLITNQMSNYVREFPDIAKATIFDLQALRYGVGGHYNFHVDDGPGLNRKYSSILMLNNDYEGGQLAFKIDGEIKTIENKPGQLVIWPSNFMFPHAVTPMTKGVRYSVVSWMC
tara:strand:+ start:3134 stop:3703 length:570 start_codon:yes stop_codon:yes gene_type:complete